MIYLLFFITGLFGTMHCMRDPFAPLDTKKVEISTVVHKKIRLAGLAKYHNSYSGIIDDGKESHVVFKGAQIKNIFVNDIGSNFIVISHNG